MRGFGGCAGCWEAGTFWALGFGEGDDWTVGRAGAEGAYDLDSWQFQLRSRETVGRGGGEAQHVFAPAGESEAGRPGVGRRMAQRRG